jgi:hypothetical protein
MMGAKSVHGAPFRQGPARKIAISKGSNGVKSFRTIGKTCSFLSTKHSISTGFEPSYARNSFILAGSSSALLHLIAWTPIALAKSKKSGFVIFVCE